MIEADISPAASQWADALLQKVGCQVSALISHRGRLSEVGRLVEGKCVSVSVCACVFTLYRWTLLHYHLERL